MNKKYMGIAQRYLPRIGAPALGLAAEALPQLLELVLVHLPLPLLLHAVGPHRPIAAAIVAITAVLDVRSDAPGNRNRW